MAKTIFLKGSVRCPWQSAGKRAREARRDKASRRVVELADAADSKSAGVQAPCGFDSHLRHQENQGLRAFVGGFEAPPFLLLLGGSPPTCRPVCCGWTGAGREKMVANGYHLQPVAIPADFTAPAPAGRCPPHPGRKGCRDRAGFPPGPPPGCGPAGRAGGRS